MGAWFRMYDEILDDPKVQRLPLEDFKNWVNILCFASRNGGRIPQDSDLAFALRTDDIGARSVVDRLTIAGLIDTCKGGANGSYIAPHAWSKRQYKSDTSTERVKRFRERFETVSETPRARSETDTESDKKERSSNDDPKKKVGHRIPSEWWPDDKGIAFAEERNLPESTADEFKDYWAAATKNALKLDWSAAWRTWCRNASSRPQPRLSLVQGHDPRKVAIDAHGIPRWRG